MELITSIILATILGVCFLLLGASKVLPVVELKRRARGKNDREAAAIYKLKSYGLSLDLMLWLIASLVAAELFLTASRISALVVVALALIIGLVLFQASYGGFAGWQWKAAAAAAPLAGSLLSALQPLLGRLSDWIESRRLVGHRSYVYEKQDLLELINSQNHRMDNRIPEAELKIAFNALTFGDKGVGSVMTPRRMIKLVAAGETIGPLLMDELHASGFSRFPVVAEPTKSANPKIVGMLYLHDLIGHTEKGRVRDVMKKKVSFINEAQNLRDALGAFLKTDHHLLVVVNNFEELVGVIAIEDVVEQILGEKIVDEFDRYDDMRAVAGLEAKQEHGRHSSDPSTAKKD
ncbi:CBS domain-containing protein [Candidatus Saccharibacteria bacterium]|nr:CBS domain-containing protein [Candidatus Saccharibacteria bacterium]